MSWPAELEARQEYSPASDGSASAIRRVARPDEKLQQKYGSLRFKNNDHFCNRPLIQTILRREIQISNLLEYRESAADSRSPLCSHSTSGSGEPEICIRYSVSDPGMDTVPCTRIWPRLLQ